MKRLTQLRREGEWSQAELARRASLNQNTVSMIERGRLIPYPGQVAKLVAAFGLSEIDTETLLEEMGDVVGAHPVSDSIESLQTPS